MALESGTRGKLVIGNLNEVLPHLKEEWVLPANFERTIPSQPRSTTWLQDEIVDDLAQFLGSEISRGNAAIEELRVKTTQADQEKSVKEEELNDLIAELESIRTTKMGADHE
jgi:hypothetical protein